LSQTLCFNSNIESVEVKSRFLDVVVTQKRDAGWGCGWFVYNGTYWGNPGRRKIEHVCKALGVTEQYLDGIEDMWKAFEDYIGDHISNELRERSKRLDEYYEELYNEELVKLSDKYENFRDIELKRWREETPRNNEDVPEALKGIEHLKRLEVADPCYIYFLMDDEEVVYVGKTTNAWPCRVKQHVDDGQKKFNDVWYIRTLGKDLDSLEIQYIKKYKPKYNVEHNRAGGVF